ncbi:MULTISPECIES: hypothetical protein [Marivita]|uniref:D-galactarate dehydratase n=1 Tax=Marivita cryptomonadis TaxID=505252 RepID=A0A9Q2NYN4_9RHOB|nr:MULTISPECIES: hypothetical protein [Marivita]MCR9169388.1 hypothetical protein [Paracoccaceae bacterium]MBM2322370.1 hypothetical protein [Marivita cryptomonadis]MBM2331952.1 hypothetical protein [Marivita cryptomonadis]MBM2341536.1 hypothetical protein [Marivita cryptomonadis]MBM2346200.1 hypothetical protein [Marivita cryptomonadis]
MRKTVGILGLCGILAGCGQVGLLPSANPTQSEGQTRPQSRPDALQTEVRLPPTNARTVDEFDTTTAEERAAAVAPTAASAEQALGSTVVSLGSPAQPGFWLETSLVSAPAKGRVLYPATGESVQVDLIPIDGGGSRLSLPAMRLIGVPLTDLAEVQVFSGG